MLQSGLESTAKRYPNPGHSLESLTQGGRLLPVELKDKMPLVHVSIRD